MKFASSTLGRFAMSGLVWLGLLAAWAGGGLDSRAQDATGDSQAAPAVTDAAGGGNAAGGDNAASGAPAGGAPRISMGKSMLQAMRDGGPLMYPIAACSFLLVVFVFERAIALRRGRVIPGPFTRKFLEQLQEGLLDRESALDLCEENMSPASQVFAAAVKKWGKAAVEVEQAILDAGERVTNDLRRYIRLFNAISTVSPLLGLLGTVLGMISCFSTISSADAMGRPELLAGGIGEALLTTAAGLGVAVPALIAYWFFVSRVDALVMDIDAMGQQIVEVISAEAKLDAARQRARREKSDKAERAADKAA